MIFQTLQQYFWGVSQEKLVVFFCLSYDTTRLSFQELGFLAYLMWHLGYKICIHWAEKSGFHQEVISNLASVQRLAVILAILCYLMWFRVIMFSLINLCYVCGGRQDVKKLC